MVLIRDGITQTQRRTVVSYKHATSIGGNQLMHYPGTARTQYEAGHGDGESVDMAKCGGSV